MELVIFILTYLNMFSFIITEPVIKVGAIFPQEAEQNFNYPEMVFQYAVHKLNLDKSLLPDTQVVHHTQYITNDSFQAVQKVCNLIHIGVQAIFSPSNSALAAHINSICAELDIPDIGTGRSTQEFSINVHPSKQYVNYAFIDVIQYLNWTRFGILYEKNYGILALNQLSRSVQSELHIRQVSPTSYFSVLKEFKHKEIHNIIIDTNSADIAILLKNVEWKGLTGPIQFKEGQRVQFKLDLIKLKQHSIVKVGEWTPQNHLNITEPSLFFDTGSMNVTLVVITILETPYVMMRYGKNFTGNERFYGFCVDILETVAREVGFDYILDLVPDRKYGAKDPETGQWNGMVAELMKYKADLAVGSMTITYARESVIDFTKPFMNLGISILFKVPTTQPNRLFSFLNPLAIEIWIYVIAAYLLVSLTIYIVAKLSPMEWQFIIPCDLENITKRNQFSFSDSLWFTIGTLMQQGSDIHPKAVSTRIITSIWGFFSLIIVASYTANLAAFLTVERMMNPIENADDLASQTEISYGTLESGSTMTFFRDSMIETYKKMWRIMDNKRQLAFTTTYEDGIRRVNQGNYAFLMESTMLDYIVQRDCNLTQIGGLLDTKGYGIATPKGSPWRDKISLAILELQEKGDIQMLYDKWWKNTDETCKRKSSNKHSKANALGLESIGGVFVVLIAGILIAFIVALSEFLINFRNQENTKRNHQCISNKNNCNTSTASIVGDAQDDYRQPPRSLWAEVFEELRFALWCTNKRQKPQLRTCCEKCQINK
ncbi:glutamate receptor ionotropic, kainate 2 isoform X2 [Drosophila albomicans]|uniref:Glutamate receptor ionotropic, kainate 2 isoform X2 n=1 Tax=Drosophila albomicans TaxID=7291 RepID=A0A9C6T9A2_DROAB|nr:glutamate receptor ionotropic, kainate 2 isoform X2 [Drosophila albomicans]